MKGKNRKLLARTIGLTMRLAVFVTLLHGSMPVMAADADPADPSVPKLEKKFFEHTYPKDALPQRLERIEKMVFGESKTGADGERLSKLIQAVPGLSSVPDAPAASPSSGSTASGDAQDVPMAPPSKSRPQQAQNPSGGTKYPQVDAMEQKLLGKSFSTEPVDQRLARLEIQAFGKPSSSTDLSDRVDALKSKTGVDITKNAPLGADWADDDDTFMSPPTAQHRAPTTGADGRSFSGRDLRNDLNSAFNRSNRGGNSDDQDVPFTGSGSYGGRGGSSAYSAPSASGSYGFGGGSTGSSGSSGSYGFGGGGNYQRSTAPRTAYQSTPPAYQSAPQAMPDTSSGMGLNQQVTALEQEVLNKTYSKDPLPLRVERLETNIIPKDKVAWQDKPLPERVNHLISIIPISAPSMVKNQRVAQSPDVDPDFPEMANASNMPKPAPQRSGGLSKIMNSLGNMLGGSGYSTGYGMSGNLMTDPQTGLLMDPNSGNLIDPSSGMVIGRRVVQPQYGYNQYGMGGMGGMGMNGFGNGFSPYGSSFGVGGSGMRMGIGGGRVGGMWP